MPNENDAYALPAEKAAASVAVPPPKFLVSLYELAEVLVSAVLVIAALFLFFFRFAGVVGSSMEPTLQPQDWLAVSAFSAKPETGDIVIIAQPNAFNEPLVKRVIATQGQTIDIRENRVYIDGSVLEEPYLPADTVTAAAPWYDASVALPAVVPQGYVFVMGDNRAFSSDSRRKEVGFIRNDYILGKVCLRLKPFGQFVVE
ncbi:MAG: signal peptidase I [Oscillospiraceae bacterium]|jgi:signal peptidase I|nr:signal peptidase I [Oscillospiraceae bacterium]